MSSLSQPFPPSQHHPLRQSAAAASSSTSSSSPSPSPSPADAQQQPPQADYVLQARIENARKISNILKAIHFKDKATCFLSPKGLKFTVEDAKCIQANAFLQAGLFQKYTFNGSTPPFRISLDILLDCLSIFGGTMPNSGMSTSNPTSLNILYTAYGFPLNLLLEEGGIFTECDIRTLDPEEVLDFDFRGSEVLNKVFMKSEALKDAFMELDVTSEFLEIVMSPEKPYFRLSTAGQAGTVHVDYPHDSDVMDSFECQKSQVNRYRMHLLRPAIKALVQSSKTSIRMNERGVLSLQFMIQVDESQTSFVEYLCAPEDFSDEDTDPNTIPELYDPMQPMRE